MALVPSVGLYYLAAVAAGLQKYHPRPAGLTGFIKLELEMGSIKRKGEYMVNKFKGTVGT